MPFCATFEPIGGQKLENGIYLLMQDWCLFLCFLVPGIVSHNFQSAKMASKCHFVPLLSQSVDKNDKIGIYLLMQDWCRFICFLVPGIVSHNFQTAKSIELPFCANFTHPVAKFFLNFADINKSQGRCTPPAPCTTSSP